MRIKEHWLDCIPELSGCIGKTIAGCDQDGSYIVFRFSDGSCLTLQCDNDEGVDSWAHPQSRINLENDSVRRAAKRAGVITAEKFKKIGEENQRRYIDRRKAQYEELRREFENK